MLASRRAVSGSLPLVVPGGNAFDQGVFIYDSALADGFRIIRDCNGHGVGEALHEQPGIVHWPARYLRSVMFRPGNIFTIEPIFTERSGLSVSGHDGVSGFTEMGDVGTYREVTVLVTENGAEVIA